MDLNRLIIAVDPERILKVLQDPRANPREAAIIAGLLVVAAVIAIVLLIMVFAPEAPEPRASARPQRTSESTRRRRLIGRIVGWSAVALVVLGVFVWAFRLTGDPATCVRCHGPELNVSWSEASHGSVTCLGCHAGPGAGGAIAARTAIVGDAGRRLAGISPRQRDAVVADEPCASCHAEQINETLVVASIRVRHSDFLAVGYKCVECHAGVGHAAEVADRATPRMERCVPCHDGERAPADCDTCHTGDVGIAGQTALRGYPKSVDLGRPTSCRGCHEIDSCNKCHGLELPHSREFVTSGHAMQAAFGRKEMCTKCHEVDAFCNRCHSFYPDGGSTHGDGFRTSHMYQPQACGCHAKQTREEMCELCH